MPTDRAPPTLSEILLRRAALEPHRLAYSFLVDGEAQVASVTYGELDSRARALALRLREACSPGANVLLLHPSGLGFIEGLFACFYAGMTAIPAHPPEAAHTRARLSAILRDAQPAAVLADAPPDDELAPITLVGGALRNAPPIDPPIDWPLPVSSAATPALIQYTSGSTSTPKGVIVTHGNLVHNQATIAHTLEVDERSVIVSWLPVHHDMGLTHVLQALYSGALCVSMSPAHFLRRPVRWLEAISRHGGTTSGGPSFAYEHCLRRITPQQARALDLRSWRVAYNGSEPVRARTLQRFAERFAPQGFSEHSFRPCYGLAEATLMVTCGGVDGAVTTVERNGPERELVGCGAARGCRVAIVSPEGVELGPGQEGEIWVCGPSVAAGYWNRPAQTRATFGARLAAEPELRFLRTGDLGFVQQGELFITGRLKDLIIIRGQNHYPRDLELTAERCDPVLQPGTGAAFAVASDDGERAVVVQEAPRGRGADAGALADAIQRAVREQHGLPLAAVVVIRPGTLPRTTSGKVMRAACRERWLAGQLAVVARWSEASIPDDASAAATPATLGSIRAFLLAATAARLGVDEAELDAEQPIASHCIDSLAAVDLAHTVEARFGVALPVTSFLGDASLSSLATHVLAEASAQAPAALPTAAPDGALQPGQRARWLLEQVTAPELAANVVARAARVVGTLDVGALRRSLERVVQRHPALRTTFGSSGGEPEPRVHDQLAPELREHDARGLDQARLAELLDQEAWRPFDLERGPLLRVHVFERDEGEHVLLFAAHHIVVDLWSMEILFMEWAALHAEERGGPPAQLRGPTSGAAGTAVGAAASRLHAGSDRLARYWKSRLDGELPRVSLPPDRRPPSPRHHRGATIHFTLDAALTRGIDALADAERVTPYMVLLAALDLLLLRYTGQADVIIGTPTAGRGPRALRSTVGCFINPVAIRVDLSGDPTLRSLLARVREAARGALEHRAYPFDELVEQLAPPRHPDRPPLFDVLLVWMEAHDPRSRGVVPLALGEAGARLDLGGLALESISLRSQPTPFELELLAGRVGDELHGALTYDTELYEASTAARLVEHLCALLRRMLEDPEQSTSRLSLLGDDERRALLAASDPGPRAPCEHVHALFLAHAAAAPEAIAISFEGKATTYGELAARSTRLAERLRAAGAGAERPIALALDEGPSQVIGMLAVLQAGSAFVCIDACQPHARIEQILADVGPSHLVTSTALARSRPPTVPGCEVLLFEGSSDDLQAPVEPPRAEASPRAAAYVVYTSGSGGTPKGIVQSHASFCQFLRWQIERFSMGPSQRIAQWATITYDAAYCEIFGALCSGATLCMARASTRHDPAALLAWVEREAVTLLQVVPSFGRRVLECLPAAPSPSGDPMRSVQWMLLAGEVLPVGLARDFLARYPTRPALFNLYGPSETVLATCYPLTSVRDHARSIPIGRPFRGRGILILDAHQQPCPQGAIGEIYVRSRDLTLGYHGRPEETARAYLPAPWATDPADRMYRTGDRGRWLPCGALEFCGRVDEQVKIRGVRVELGEVEAVLRRQATVEDCAVITCDDGHGSTYVVAYVVMRAAGSTDALREATRAVLAPQAVPAAFVRLDALPLTRTGKIDRRSLPRPSRADFGVDDRGEPPRSPSEALVADVWKEVLGIAAVARDQSFFALGGHSLTAMQVLNRLRRRTGVEVPLTRLFEAPTVAALAAHIEASEQASPPELARLVQEIEDLTDEEVESLLRDSERS